VGFVLESSPDERVLFSARPTLPWPGTTGEESTDIDLQKLESEFAPGTWFDIYDYGIGDEIMVPNVVTVSEF